MGDWRRLFVGREDEIGALAAAFAKAQAGEPQLAVLLAETGWGKTRIIQEFFSLLCRDSDPEGYWPDSIAEVENWNRTRRTQINPDLGDRAGAAPPFLWLGIAFQQSRQTGQSELIRVQSLIAPHVRPLLTQWSLGELTKEDRQILTDLGFETVDEASQALEKTLTELGSTIPILKDAITARKVWKALKALRKHKENRRQAKKLE